MTSFLFLLVFFRLGNWRLRTTTVFCCGVWFQNFSKLSTILVSCLFDILFYQTNFGSTHSAGVWFRGASVSTLIINEQNEVLTLIAWVPSNSFFFTLFHVLGVSWRRTPWKLKTTLFKALLLFVIYNFCQKSIWGVFVWRERSDLIQ